ncbi:uncharacterized protein LY89DRAFT_46596 [Mollisia scopiformis]|uniref:Uncharacterized protein n=1 Tax=Mollisia scopiformis TaxID=149040 RepID=A0A194XDX3_MOLSC|nr:uncharacterized protein LY89DRAFT_46596 [Mollisia scopiformis]KUJ18349.1 hypothetical protein LY89DRAFT_46596 [Mollisia scopiformis]
MQHQFAERMLLFFCSRWFNGITMVTVPLYIHTVCLLIEPLACLLLARPEERQDGRGMVDVTVTISISGPSGIGLVRNTWPTGITQPHQASSRIRYSLATLTLTLTLTLLPSGETASSSPPLQEDYSYSRVTCDVGSVTGDHEIAAAFGLFTSVQHLFRLFGFSPSDLNSAVRNHQPYQYLAFIFRSLQISLLCPAG